MTHADLTSPADAQQGIKEIEAHIYGGKPGERRDSLDDLLFLLAYIRTLEKEHRAMRLWIRAIKQNRDLYISTVKMGAKNVLSSLTLKP